MRSYIGKPVYKGVRLGPVIVIKDMHAPVKREKADSSEAELKRLEKACDKTKNQLQKLYHKAVREAGEASAAIFQAHQMILEDEDFLKAIRSMIEREQVNAEYAVAATEDRFSEMLAGMDDEHMKARAADIKDVSNRLLRNLSGQKEIDWEEMEPAIIIAEDLSPSETVRMDKDKILALVTVHGSSNSHTAILARTMNIPALIGVPLELDSVRSGTLAVVNGTTGEVILEPEEETCRRALALMEEEEEQLHLLQSQKGKETITTYGSRIRLYANIGRVADAGYAIENDAEGIGLFRSEFLYLGRTELPTEEEQFQAYKKVLRMMAGKQVIIRTLDIGADKKADCLTLGKEENPALGCRGIRVCLKQPEIFKTQLRALLRAAVYGDLAVMYPMIISVEEIKKIQGILSEVRTELEELKVPYKMPEQGIMIETPAAVMISDELAELVDFFSIGTNDLTQYTLAIDRQNEKLDEFYDPHHRGVLRMIRMVVDNAHKAGKRAGICGELGADPELTEAFIKMGVDELSVAPSMILKLRKLIREL